MDPQQARGRIDAQVIQESRDPGVPPQLPGLQEMDAGISLVVHCRPPFPDVIRRDLMADLPELVQCLFQGRGTLDDEIRQQVLVERIEPFREPGEGFEPSSLLDEDLFTPRLELVHGGESEAHVKCNAECHLLSTLIRMGSVHGAVRRDRAHLAHRRPTAPGPAP
ncbi:hypothetical protein ACXNSR_03075 [Streptomyces sp. NC-S4]